MLLRYALGGDRPSQTTHQTLSATPVRANVRTSNIKGWYFKVGSTQTGVHASKPPTYPHIKAQCSVSSYSKGSRGLSVLPRVHCIFTASSISLSLGWRQHAIITPFVRGRNLPDKEFRYLRTVIVTAAVYRASIKSFSLRITPSINLPAPGRRHTYTSTFVFAQCCVFNKQLQPAGIFDWSQLHPQGLHLHTSVPSPEVTAPFCLVPSPEFSQAPWYSLPDHLCRFGVRFDVT